MSSVNRQELKKLLTLFKCSEEQSNKQTSSSKTEMILHRLIFLIRLCSHKKIQQYLRNANAKQK